MVAVGCLNISLAIDHAVDNGSLYLIPLVWISSGVLLVMVAAVMVVWLEVCVCARVRVLCIVHACVYVYVFISSSDTFVECTVGLLFINL